MGARGLTANRKWNDPPTITRKKKVSVTPSVQAIHNPLLAAPQQPVQQPVQQQQQQQQQWSAGNQQGGQNQYQQQARPAQTPQAAPEAPVPEEIRPVVEGLA